MQGKNIQLFQDQMQYANRCRWKRSKSSAKFQSVLLPFFSAVIRLREQCNFPGLPLLISNFNYFVLFRKEGSIMRSRRRCLPLLSSAFRSANRMESRRKRKEMRLNGWKRRTMRDERLRELTSASGVRVSGLSLQGVVYKREDAVTSFN